MELFLLIIRLFLAAIFLIAGIGKLLDLKGSGKAVKDFGVPEIFAPTLALLIPLAEISLAVMLIFVQTSWFGAIGAFALLLIFIGGMLWQMKQGNASDCHCFGQIHSEPVSLKSLIRNVLFAVGAGILIFAGSENQGLAVGQLANNYTEVMQIILGLITVGLLLVFVVYLKNIMDKQTQILRRLEVLEIIAGDGTLQEREDVGNPNEGLPIGSPLPSFQMPTADGRVVTLDDLLQKGKPILFWNVSPTCNPCAELLPEIEIWEKELAEKVTFVFISKGSLKENLAKFAADVDRTILIQDDRELAELMEIRWTPTILFANRNGIVASHPAAGDEAIRDLIEKIKKENLDNEFVHITNTNGNGLTTKIGEEIPQFLLKDITGREISKNDFTGKKTLITFWSQTCPYCVEMLEELREWDQIKGKDEPNLLVFSDGAAETFEHFDLTSPVVLDEEYEISEKLGMAGTPSAVMINESGKIISETAVGAGQIWALLGRRK